jgi:hypothetical protein
LMDICADINCLPFGQCGLPCTLRPKPCGCHWVRYSFRCRVKVVAMVQSGMITATEYDVPSIVLPTTNESAADPNSGENDSHSRVDTDLSQLNRHTR